MLVVVPICVFPNVGQCSAFKLTNHFILGFTCVELYFFVRLGYVEPILKFMVRTVVWPIFNFCLQSRACEERLKENQPQRMWLKLIKMHHPASVFKSMIVIIKNIQIRRLQKPSSL